MLLFFLVVNILETVAFDIPLLKNKLGQPEVAVERKKLSKYFDLVEQKWKNTNHGYKTSYSQLVRFCRMMYPDLDVQDVYQGSYQMLTFCSVKTPSKCSEVDTVTWLCSTGKTDPTVSPPSTMVPVDTTDQCLNETTRPVQYEKCTPVVIIAQINKCLEYNQTLSKMFPVKSCEVKDAEGRSTAGLLSAELLCCSKTAVKISEHVKRPSTLPPIIPPKGDIPFSRFNPSRGEEKVVPIAAEWCNLTGVEDRRKQNREETLRQMQQIYNSSTDIDKSVGQDRAMAKIKEMERNMDKEVIKMYAEHFICLTDTVKSTMRLCNEFFSGIIEYDKKKLAQNEEVLKWKSDVEVINKTLTQVQDNFSQLCELYEKGNKGRFTSDYHHIVEQILDMRQRIDTIKTKIDIIEDTDNCVECTTDDKIITDNNNNNNNLPVNPDINMNRDDDDPDNNSTQQKLNNQKYLIAIVSTVSIIVILVAVMFFAIVVRRCVRDDLRNRAYTCYPANDILTTEQYVAFLQKNGYANPTCRLPQKYLDDHD